MLQKRYRKGYSLWHWYNYCFERIMFNPRYKDVSNKLLKRYVVYTYLKGLRGN